MSPGSGSDAPRRRLMRWLPAVMLVAAFLLQWLLLMNILGPTWDAAFYYGFGRSLAFDQDLSLVNDLQLSYPTASPDFVARELHANLTETGSVYAPFAIGSGFLWLPLLLVLRAAAEVGGLPASTGFEWYFVASVTTFSALTGLLTFYLSYYLAQGEAGPLAALIAALTMSVGSPLIYYQFREPLYAHVPSALFNTLFLVFWWRSYRQIPAVRQGLCAGVFLGLAALMRWQNVIYIILPLFSSGWAWLRQEPDDRRQTVQRLLAYLAATGGAFLIVFSAQFYVWQTHYGSWLTIPQGDSFMVWESPFLRELLFSPFRGILPWMPVAGLAVIGLLLQARRKPRLVIPLLVVLAVSTYVNASSRDWFAGGGYGPRRSVGELAIFVMGYAWFIKAIPARLRLLAAAIAGALFILHQWLLLRFALAERIGGRVISMAPAFEWTEASPSEFLRQLAAHIPDLIRQPRDVFVFPGSPLHHVLQSGTLPVRHLLSLLVAATFLAVVLFLGDRLRRQGPSFLNLDERQKKTAQA